MKVKFLIFVFISIFFIGCGSPNLGSVYKGEKWCSYNNNQQICTHNVELLPIVDTSNALYSVVTDVVKVNGKKIQNIDYLITLIKPNETKQFHNYVLNKDNAYISISVRSSINESLYFKDSLVISNNYKSISLNCSRQDNLSNNHIERVCYLDNKSMKLLSSSNVSIQSNLTNGITKRFDIKDTDMSKSIRSFISEPKRKMYLKEKARQKKKEKEEKARQEKKEKARQKKKEQRQRIIDKKISDNFISKKNLQKVTKIKVNIKLNNEDEEFFNSLDDSDNSPINME